MESEIEHLEKLKDLLHRRLQELLALTEERTPASVAAQEARQLWDGISAVEATLDVFGNPGLRRDIEEGLREIAAGDVMPWESVRKRYFAPERPPDKRDV